MTKRKISPYENADGTYKTYDEVVKIGKADNRVYKGIRYYADGGGFYGYERPEASGGDVYLTLEKDDDMKYPFHRFCSSLTPKEVEKAIDRTGVDYYIKLGKESIAERIEQEREAKRAKIKELEREIEELNNDYYKIFFDV